jgi:hypothetical protein
MEILFEIFFQFFGELLLQIIFEVLAEFGLRGVGEVFRKKPNPWMAALGHIILGAIAGGLSLWLFPKLLISGRGMQLLNLALTPVLSGAAMGALGHWRNARGQVMLRLDRFTYGYLFALTMALLRFQFA